MCGNVSTVLLSAAIGIFAAVLGSVVGSYSTYKFMVLRDFRLARAGFFAAFAELYARCRGGNMTYSLADSFTGTHEAAITEFGFWVNKDDRTSFETACKKYRNCRNPQKTPSQASNDFFTPTQTAELAKAIDKLLSYANAKP